MKKLRVKFEMEVLHLMLDHRDEDVPIVDQDQVLSVKDTVKERENQKL